MKRTLTTVAAAAIALGTIVPMAFANTTSSTVGGQKAISVNGTVVSNPFTRVANDAGTQTSYIGVWYLGQAVKAAGGDYNWDSSTKVFAITAPGVDASKISVQGGVGTGDTDITVNGVLVKKVNSFAAQDPAGSKSDITTYMPLFYLGEIFGNLGGSSWDGNTFGFQKFVQVGAAASVKLAASTSSLVADGTTKSATSITGTVIDANGNTVSDYNGPVNVSVNGTDVTLDKTSYTAANGVFTVTATNNASAKALDTDQIIASLPGVTGSTGIVTLSEVAPTAKYIDVTGAPKALQEMTSNTNFTVGLQATDELHQVIAASAPGTATVTVSGPAMFQDGTKTQTVTALGDSALALTQLANQTGAITLTITAVNGSLVSGNPVSINVVKPGTATAWTLTSAAANTTTSFTADQVSGWTSSAYTYEFQAQDPSQLAVAPATAPTASVTLNGKAQSAFTTDVTAGVGTGVYDVKLTTEGSIAAGTYTLTVIDGSMQSYSVPLTVTAGAAYGVTVTPDASITTYDVTSANPSTPVIAQLVDKNGNTVAQSGIAITFKSSAPDTLTLSGGAGSTSSQTVYTNSSGVATITAAAAANTPGNDGYLTISGAGLTTGGTSANIYELGTQSVAKLTSSVTYKSGTSYTAGSALQNADYPTVAVGTLDAADAPFSSSDTLQYTISGPAAYGTNGSTTGNVVKGSVPVITNIAGAYTVTVKDVSNTNVTPVTATVTVVAGAYNGIDFFTASGSNVTTGATSPITTDVTADTPVALTVKAVDSYGNVVSSTSPITVSTLVATNSSGAIIDGAFKDASGSVVTSVTIPAGQSSATVYFVDANAKTGVTFSASGVPAAATATLKTAAATTETNSVVLTYSSALSAASQTTSSSASNYTVTVNGASDTVTGVAVDATSGTVTLTLAANVVSGQTVTVSYVPGTNPVTDANGNNVAAISNQIVSVS